MVFLLINFPAYWGVKISGAVNYFIIENKNFNEIEQIFIKELTLHNYSFVESEPFNGSIKYEISNNQTHGTIHFKRHLMFSTIGFSESTNQDFAIQTKINLAVTVNCTPMRDKKYKTKQRILKFLLLTMIAIEFILIIYKFF